jgi:AcrR family transcriptional regulator
VEHVVAAGDRFLPSVVSPKVRREHHHGDLRNALVDAATELAREGGPDAVVLREAARRVGVTAAAAYHHFASRDQLIQAIKQRALALLADYMQSALTQDQSVPTQHQRTPGGQPGRQPPGAADMARRRLRGLGAAYLRFAFAEPGLFQLTFGPRGPWPTGEPARPHDQDAGPFVLLSEVLDELAAAGAIPPERRPGLEYVTWAEVHGVAALCLDGPLARIDPTERQETIERALDTIIRGL